MNFDNPMSLCKTVLVTVVGFALGGCATAPKPDTQFLARPLKVRLAQVPIRDRDAVRSVVAPDHPESDPEAEKETSQAIEAAQSQALADMTRAFETFTDLRINNLPLMLPTPLDRFPVIRREASIAPNMLTSLRAASDADVLLRFGISDYGLTPRAWRSGVITFEVMSTLGIAAIAYAKPATRAIAGVYLAQETIEETIEAYSGFWALNEVYRPVRIEAEMIDLKTGQTVWADSETGFSDRRLSRIFMSVTPDERKAQLSAALHDAITKVVRDFEQSAGRQITPATMPTSSNKLPSAE